MIAFERFDGSEVACHVMLDHGCSIRLVSDEPEGDREWRILEFEVGYVTYDMRASAHTRRSHLGPEPLLPESDLLRSVRRAWAAFVADERLAQRTPEV